jgi:hypothetical protein
VRSKKEKAPQSLAAGGTLSPKENQSGILQDTGPISVSDDSTILESASVGPAVDGRVTVDHWLAWLRSVDFRPAMFMTLTYDNRYSEMPAEWVRSTWKWLVHRLNKDVAGDDYKRKFKHSYFSYVMALEYQKRGALHIHALIENPNEAIRYMRVHELWSPKFGGRFGFAWISHVPNPKLVGLNALKAGSEDAALRYVLKYVLKDGSPLVWIKKKRVEVRTVDLRPFDGPSNSIVGAPAPKGRRAQSDSGQFDLGIGGDRDKEKPEGD